MNFDFLSTCAPPLKKRKLLVGVEATVGNQTLHRTLLHQVAKPNNVLTQSPSSMEKLVETEARRTELRAQYLLELQKYRQQFMARSAGPETRSCCGDV